MITPKILKEVKNDFTLSSKHKYLQHKLPNLQWMNPAIVIILRLVSCLKTSFFSHHALNRRY